jgi:2,5-diketo-D-gluconate reductase B
VISSIDDAEGDGMSIYFRHTYQRAFGTFPLKDQTCKDAIAIALSVGYRAFDTAQMYQNEAAVGEALANGGVARAELCITTKVGIDNFGEDRFLPSVEQSLKDLRTDYVDALLLHWPAPDGDIAPSLKLLEKALHKGLTRNIGISNFTAQMMRDAKSIVDAPLVVNQVEFHPLLDQGILLRAAIETGIPLSSYCSVARGKVFENPLFAEIGGNYGKSAGQIALRWILQQGVPLNTMSTKTENIRANFDIMDFVLSSIDMARIEALTHTNYRIVGRDLIPYAPVFD